MRDALGRRIDYLRVSVTDRCNLRCGYCVPPEGAAPFCPEEILMDEEILTVLRVARELGITHVRVTGGEPLVRKGIVPLVKAIKATGFPDVSMTTNGALLAEYAADLKEAGLDRVNISLDSLRPSTYRTITGNGKLEDVLEGIRSALSAGLHPVKINVVPMKGTNESEIPDLAGLSVDSPLHVRFIEVMPVGPALGSSGVPAKDIVAEIKKRWGQLVPIPGPVGAGPAKSFRIHNAKGTVGIISAMSSPFCDECNRLRLTSDGRLRPCLSLDTEIDIKSILRTKDPDAPKTDCDASERDLVIPKIEDGLRKAFGQALELKPKCHDFYGSHTNHRPMCQIGG